MSQRRGDSDNEDKESFLGKSDVNHESNRNIKTFYNSHHFQFLAVIFVVLGILVVAFSIAVSLTISFYNRDKSDDNHLPSDSRRRAEALLERYPVIDGHNDLPYQARLRFQNQLDEFDLLSSTAHLGWHTDIPRLREGRVGAQFWSAYMDCNTQYRDAARTFIDQIDVIKRMIKKYPETFELALSADDITRTYYKNKKIASLIGVEGGHAIDSSLGALRGIYELGARYMTLTHNCDTPWADSASGPKSKGLTEFGQRIVREMNRLGIMVDISHVSADVMRQVLSNTLAPVIFSHSSAYALCETGRNVPDDVLKKLPENGGIVMVNFYPGFINCSMTADLEQVADHIDYIKNIAGIDYVGIGGDYDGMPVTPKGLEDVSKYPALFAELIRRNYSDDDIAKVAHSNLIRVFKQVEKVRDALNNVSPDDTLISPQPNQTCRPDF